MLNKSGAITVLINWIANSRIMYNESRVDFNQCGSLINELYTSQGM